MASPTVEINSASLGGWTTTENGIDVLGGETVSVRLIDSAGIRLWHLTVASTDELTSAPTITQAGSVSGTATFQAPSDPTECAIKIQSQVGFYALGWNARSELEDGYTTTFGVFVRTTEGLRVGAVDETFEGSSTYGWVVKINELVRRAPATGTGVSTGRTLNGTSPIRIDGGASGDLSANRTISLTPGSVAGQVLGWDGASWVARQVAVLTGLTLTGFSDGVLHAASGVVSSSTIVNTDISASAAVAVSKLAPGTNGQGIITAGGVAVWGTVVAGSVTAGTARQIYVTNASPAAAWATVAGDISSPTTAGTFRVDKINGTAVTTAAGGAVGSVLRMTGTATSDWGAVDLADADAVTGLLPLANLTPGTNGQWLTTAAGVAAWAALTVAASAVTPGTNGQVLTTTGGVSTWATIVNANVDAAAAIAGTKIAPNFGSQNVITTGTLSAGAATVTGLTVSVLGLGIVHSSSGGVFSSSTIVDADVSASAAIAVTKLGQGGATTGQAITWNGSTWAPGAPVGTIGVGSNGQILVTAGGVATWATSAGDWTGTITANVVGKINGATVPVGGSLTTGNSLQVTGAGALSYAPVNLGGGSNYVTGGLPLANIAQGGAVANDVMRWNGSVWDPEPLANLLPTSASTVQIVADMPALEALSTTSLSDRILCIVQTPAGLYWLNKSGTPAASGDMHLPPASPSGRWESALAA